MAAADAFLEWTWLLFQFAILLKKKAGWIKKQTFWLVF